MDLIRTAARHIALDAATINLAGQPAEAVFGAGRQQLDALLPEFLQSQRWFAGKGSTIESARLADVVAIPSATGAKQPVGHLAMVDVRYAGGAAPERYATALVLREPGSATLDAEGVARIARVRSAAGEHVLADAATDPAIVEGLVHAMRGGRQMQGSGASLAGGGADTLEQALQGAGQLRAKPLSLHSSNTNIRVDAEDGRAYALKLVRRHDAVPEPGTPTRALDVWKGAYLTDVAGYGNTPAVLGSIEHLDAAGVPRTVSVLTEFVPNDGDGWVDALTQARGVIDAARVGTDAAVDASITSYADAARNHGRRLGELHVALSSGPVGSEFRGVREGADAVRRRADTLRHEAARTIEQLRSHGRAADADQLAGRIDERIDAFESAVDQLVPIDEIHTHGDFHLGQLLKTGDDVQIIDLEGAPALALAERWQRTMALGDVARQRSSYEYAATQALRESAESSTGVEEALRPVADRWAERSKEAFLEGWLDATRDQRFRHARTELGPELQQAELANALYETSYELGSRPDWVSIPLERLQRIVTGGAGAT
jgi:trehalose synthase-fused probable maltokinase